MKNLLIIALALGSLVANAQEQYGRWVKAPSIYHTDWLYVSEISDNGTISNRLLQSEHLWGDTIINHKQLKRQKLNKFYHLDLYYIRPHVWYAMHDEFETRPPKKYTIVPMKQ